jgi:arylamine N-acetyltransferase
LIVAKARLLAITADNQTMVYGGAVPKLTVSYSGFVNGDTPASLTQPVTASTTANSTSPPGTYPIVVSGGASSYYSLSLNNGTLTVTKAPLTVTADNKSKEYGIPVPPLTVTYSGFINGDTPSSLTQPIIPITSASTNSPPGTYPITLTGGASAKYSLAFNSGVLTISPAPLAITADSKSITYGDPLPTLTASYSGFMNGDTPASLTQPVTLATTATATSPPGTYPILVTGGASPNYSLILNNGTLTISKTRLLTVTADNQTMVYGGSVPQLTASYSGFINGDTPASLTQPVSISTTANSKSPPGTYPIVLSGGASSDYTLSLNNGTLTITQAVLTVTADNKTKVYGSTLPALTAHYSGFVNGDTAASFTKPVTLTTTATTSSPTGSYPIMPSGGVSSNYALLYQGGSLTITKAALTVTANNKIKVYGADIPTLTASYSGFVGSDSASSLTQPVVLSTTATASSPVGTYAITATGGSSPNYSLVLSNGMLTVKRALLTVNVDNQTKLYGAPLPQFTATYTGFALGDTAASLTQPVTLTSTATANSPVGVYQIAATGGSSPNYNLVLNNGALTVAPAPLIIKADDKTKTYGSPLPVLTASYSGFVNGDSPTSLTQPPVLSTTAGAASLSGKYPIVVSGAQAANYAISFVNGTLTVVQDLKAPEFLPGAVRVRVDGSLGITVVTAGPDTVRLESSEDLINWGEVGTQTATNRQAQFKLTNFKALPQRFFRAVLAP